MTSFDTDTLIIGGGIIGISTAYYLARGGASVTVIDKEDVGAGSSSGNAGLICPCHSEPLAMPGALSQGLRWLLDGRSPFYIKPRLDLDLLRWLWQFRAHCTHSHYAKAVPLLRDLQRASLALYREIIAAEAIACNFQETGGLALYRTPEGWAHGQEEAAQLLSFGLGVRVLDREAARALEPAVHPDILGAVQYEEDAFLTPDLFLHGLAEAAQGHGATILPETELLGFARSHGRLTGVQTSRGFLRAGQIVLAAGAWSAELAHMLGVRFLLQPAKGYSITTPSPAIAPRRYLYLGEARVAVTPMGQHLRCAGTLELAGFDEGRGDPINRRRVEAIRSAAQAYLAPDAAPDAGWEIWHGLRPCSPDGLPFIGRSAAVPNLLIGTGHATLGMSMGPITGKLLAQLAQELPPALPLESFGLERFS